MKTATAHRLVSAGPKRSFIELTDSGRAMPQAAPATREPSRNLRSVSAVPASVRIASDRATVWPMFTSRVHYGAPKARGHRAFILAKQEWR